MHGAASFRDADRPEVTVESINVDLGSAPLEWARAVRQLARLQPAGGARGHTCGLSTVDADCRPHTAGAVGQWLNETLFMSVGRARARAATSRGTLTAPFAISLPDLDLVLEGVAGRVTDADGLARGFQRLRRAGPAARGRRRRQ
jgi:hypothetical protein